MTSDLVIEYPAQGYSYKSDEYGVYEYDTYPDSSVLAGQMRRTSRGFFATPEEAQREFPGALWDGDGTTRARDVHIPANPPAWFDPAAAGESWDGE